MTDSNYSRSAHHNEDIKDLSDFPASVSKIDGVLVGVVAEFDRSGAPMVVFPGNPQGRPRKALSSSPLSNKDLGCEVALVFIDGKAEQPMIIGKMHNPTLEPSARSNQAEQSAEVIADGERMEVVAKQELVLKCGKASITLTKAGKILIRGTYILSRSSGANRIKGGSIQLN